MKHRVIVSAVALLSAVVACGSARAADLAPSPVASGPVEAQSPWSGAYFGVEAGYAWGDSTLLFPQTGHFSELDPSGAFGGVLFGYDFSVGNGLVLGVRGNLDLGRLDGGKQSISTHVGTQDAEGRMNDFGAITGRLGFVSGSIMPYALAGIALGKYEHAIEHIGADDEEWASATYFGGTVGVGAEYAFGGPWTAGLEYRYTDYGSKNFAAGAIGTFNTHDVDLSTNQVTASLGYHF